MTFRSAVSSLVDGQAAKIPTMSGYVKRVDVQKQQGDTWDKRYNLVFQERSDADGDGHTTYTFVFTVTGGSVSVTTSDSLVLDPGLLQAMMSGEWVIDSASAFESARTGTGLRW